MYKMERSNINSGNALPNINAGVDSKYQNQANEAQDRQNPSPISHPAPQEVHVQHRALAYHTTFVRDAQCRCQTLSLAHELSGLGSTRVVKRSSFRHITQLIVPRLCIIVAMVDGSRASSCKSIVSP